MRNLLTVCLLLACPQAYAGEPAQSTSGVKIVLHEDGVRPLSRSPVSTRMRDGELAALLEHLQSQHVYLEHLENTRRTFEKELSIVKLMRECNRLGSICTGRGILERPPPPEPPAPVPAGEETEPGPVEAPARRAEPLLPAPPSVGELPTVIGVYRETASLLYLGRHFEARTGAEIGPFTVGEVTLDLVRLVGPGGPVALPARWRPPLPGVLTIGDPALGYLD